MSMSAVAPAVTIFCMVVSRLRNLNCPIETTARRRTQVTFELNVHYGEAIFVGILIYRALVGWATSPVAADDIEHRLARLCPRGQTATSDDVGKGACEVLQVAPHRDAPLP